MKSAQREARRASDTNTTSHKEFLELQPDVLLACQVRPRNNMLHRSEWMLLWALLSDALHVLATFRPSRPGRLAKEKRQWEADLAWVRADNDGPFSFLYICDHLGLDRHAARSHIERLITEP